MLRGKESIPTHSRENNLHINDKKLLLVFSYTFRGCFFSSFVYGKLYIKHIPEILPCL